MTIQLSDTNHVTRTSGCTIRMDDIVLVSLSLNPFGDDILAWHEL